MQNNKVNLKYVLQYENGVLKQTLLDFQSLCRSEIENDQSEISTLIQKASESTTDVITMLLNDDLVDERHEEKKVSKKT